MTRINPLPLELGAFSMLSTEHLNAAWKETPRIVTHVEECINKGLTPKDIDIPKKFTFNTGHMKFFYDKLYYIGIYYARVRHEGVSRKFNYSQSNLDSMFERIQIINEIDPTWCNFWKPSEEDIYLGMARLVERHFKTNMQVIGRDVVEDAPNIQDLKFS